LAKSIDFTATLLTKIPAAWQLVGGNGEQFCFSLWPATTKSHDLLTYKIFLNILFK
jgi:hypothetical protein